MICAQNKELKIKICLGSKLLKKHPKDYTWFCPNPDCKELLSYVKDHKRKLSNDKTTQVIEHFRHHSGKICDSEPETLWHITTKKFLYHILPKFNDVKLIKLEHRINNQIADVYIELTNGTKIAIELQHSPLKYDELKKRTIGYIEKGVYPFWILDGNKTLPKLLRELSKYSWWSSIKTSQLDRDVFKMFERIYYMNFNPDNIKEVIEIYCVVLHDFKSYKTRKKMIITSILNLEIEIITTSKLKHVRFVSKEMDDILQKREEKRIKREEKRIKLLIEQEKRRKEQEERWKEEEWNRKNVLMYKAPTAEPPEIVENEYDFPEYVMMGFCTNCGEIEHIVAQTNPDKYIKRKLYLCKKCMSVYRKERFRIKKEMKKELRLSNE